MHLTPEDARKLALLARLDIPEDELQHLAPQLETIVTFVDQLSQLDTEGVEPMTHAIEAHNRWAVDKHASSLNREQALTNAPARDDEYFLVPPVLGSTS